MDLGVSLQNAISGLMAAQANLSIISSNVSNAQTPGYSRETVPLQSRFVAGTGAGVTVGLAQRQVDDNLAKAAREQDTVASAASVADTYFQQIQTLFGQVNDGTSLGDVFGNFVSALQALSATPDDQVAQQTAIAGAQALAQKLNATSQGIQQIRSGADADIASDIGTVNQALQSIAQYNVAIIQAQNSNESIAALQDKRDQAVNQVAQMIGVNTFTRSDGTLVVLTKTGKVLVQGDTAEQLSYSQTGTVTTTSPLSTITLNGLDITGDITSGKVGALLNVRDTQLPNLTAEINQFTNNLYNATQVTNSTQLVTVGGAALAVGDTFSVSINGGPPVATAALAATPPATVPSTTDLVNAINAAIGPGTIQASASGGNIVFTDSAGSTLNVTISATVGGETFTPSAPRTPFHLFAGVNTAAPLPQDNAAGIVVNPSVLANSSLLDGSLTNPDPSISQTLRDAVSASYSFAAAGNFTSGVTTTLAGYASQILGQTASATATAHDDAAFQTNLQSQFAARASNVSGVNLDEELANLTVYQNMYAASAHVMSAVQSMLDTLIKM